MDLREAYIAANMIDELGPVRVRSLVDALGDAARILKATAEELCCVKGIGPTLAKKIVQQRDTLDVEKEKERAARLNVDIVTWLDEAYPPLLREIHDPPLVLYVLGDLRKADRHAVALVGSRRCTHYGQSVADRLAYRLAQIGYSVVSGLARGIDAVAHQGALKAGGRTLAVLGSALDKIYPKENEELARKVARQGAVISEYPFGREPDRTTFPYRNRIISGISMGVVVVEAAPNSGSLISADAALDQGRTVFAVPGRIDRPSSRGCHRLIKNGAKLVEDVDDIVEEFDLLTTSDLRGKARDAMNRPEVELSPEEEKVVRALADDRLDVDSLARAADIPMATLNTLLLTMEMKKIIAMRPGRMVELVVTANDFS